MRIFHNLAEVPADFGSTIVSVGNFDGVHLAHRTVLQEVVTRAKAQHLKSLAVTFEPHPVRILRPDSAPKLVTPLPVKLKLLEKTGLDATLVLPFTRDFSIIPPREFAQEILRQQLKAEEVHEGANFHFGHKAMGNIERLVEFGKEFGFEVVIYPEQKIRGITVSSSQIRTLLERGNVDRARHLLGRIFSIAATPAAGRGYGSKYTVPTINLGPYEGLAPAHGVYITQTVINGECFDSVTNVGNRPTFGADSFAIESHLLNFHPIALTPETPVEIFFLHRLRDEIKFPSVEALRAQIAKDVQRSQRYFRALKSFSRKSFSRP
jgi:riboflavin kinase/FMN adenylyltransferase